MKKPTCDTSVDRIREATYLRKHGLYFYKFEANYNQQIQEAQRNPSRRNMKTNTQRHIITKLLKTDDKKKILKTAKE